MAGPLPPCRHQHRFQRWLGELIDRKTEIDEKSATLASQVAENRVLRCVTEEDVRLILSDLVTHIADLERAELKGPLRVLLAKIVLDPGSLNARIHYAIPAATGVMVASPRGFEPRLPP